MAKQGRRWAILLTGVVLGSAGMWCAATWHIIQTSNGRVWVPRVQAGVADLYVDIRSWTVDDWRQHPQLAQAISRAGRRDLLPAAPQHPQSPWWGRPPFSAPRPPRPVATQNDRVNR